MLDCLRCAAAGRRLPVAPRAALQVAQGQPGSLRQLAASLARLWWRCRVGSTAWAGRWAWWVVARCRGSSTRG